MSCADRWNDAAKARRGDKAIPNLKPTRVLEGHDKLLCFDRLEVMRRMVLTKTRRRRRPEVRALEPTASE